MMFLILVKLVYGILYMLFMAFPVVFVEGHGFNAGESGLTFIPLFLGGWMGVAIVSLHLTSLVQVFISGIVSLHIRAKI